MRICGCCDKLIQADEPYTAYDIPSPSGPGTTVYLHLALCRRVPTQTSQSSIRH